MRVSFRSISFAFLSFALALTASASTVAVNSARVYSAAGANSCTVSGATVATPSVVTCNGSGFVSGDQVQITGVGGTTTDNGTFYVKVLTANTFSLFSDANLQTGVTGTGAYTSGGAASAALDVSAITGPWTLRFRAEQVTAGKNLLVSIQDSADGFVSDIKTLAVFNLTGSSPVGCSGTACGPLSEYTVRNYLLPSARVGVSNGRLRLFVQSIDSSGSATLSWFFEQ